MPNLEIYPLPGRGLEHVLPAPDGHLLTGLDDGRIISYDPETGRHTLVVCQVGQKAWMAGLFYEAFASFDLPEPSGQL
jgi:hypothetical protein